MRVPSSGRSSGLGSSAARASAIVAPGGPVIASDVKSAGAPSRTDAHHSSSELAQLDDVPSADGPAEAVWAGSPTPLVTRFPPFPELLTHNRHHVDCRHAGPTGTATAHSRGDSLSCSKAGNRGSRAGWLWVDGSGRGPRTGTKFGPSNMDGIGSCGWCDRRPPRIPLAKTTVGPADAGFCARTVAGHQGVATRRESGKFTHSLEWASFMSAPRRLTVTTRTGCVRLRGRSAPRWCAPRRDPAGR
jgi:hypothetical protein